MRQLIVKIKLWDQNEETEKDILRDLNVLLSKVKGDHRPLLQVSSNSSDDVPSAGG